MTPGSVAVMTDANDFNQGVISEFRANSGAVGGNFEGLPTFFADYQVKAGDRLIPVLRLVRN